METPNCKNCENSGICYQMNGEDDVDPMYCTCIEGQRAEVAGAGTVIGIKKVAHSDSPMFIKPIAHPNLSGKHWDISMPV